MTLRLLVPADPKSGDAVFGVLREGRLAGVAGVSFETREKARHKSTLFGMYVPPRFRGGGLGRKLVDAVVEHARTRGGVKILQLTVTHGNDAAQSLYERCGFASFGIEPMAVAVGPDFVSKVHMWRRIDLTAPGEARPAARA